ncbi:retrovirus-related pol polyprotein from transposon TNT 1-94 [Tanacetum coccineum]
MAKNMVSITKCLELLHMDLFGPSAVQSYRGNFYTLVIVDDYSRYTWTRFLKHKNEAFDHFEILSKKIQVQKGCSIVSIRTDHGQEFDNEVQFGAFYDANGITHNFSAPRTPQSNRVVKRKNHTLQEMSRTMINEQSIPQNFWCNAVDTSTYILNRILIRPFLGKTPYELFKGKKPSLEYFKVFGSKCFILNTKDCLTKFDPKSTEVIMEYMVKISKKARILELKRRNLKITVLTSNTSYPSRKIQRICACTSPKTIKDQGSIRRDANPICTLGDYSKPSHEGNRNTIELPVGNNVWSPMNSVTWKNPKQAFVEYVSSCTDEAGDARLSKFEADFKQQQSEMTNKIDTVLKAIIDRIVGALPSDTVKNPKLNVNTTTSVLSARSYPTEDPQCSTHIHEDTNTIAYNEEQRDTPQLEWKDTTDIDNLGPNRDDEGIEWLDAEEPLDLVDTSEESVYESLIKEMPKCSLNYDFRIKKGDPRNLNIPCMSRHKFTANGNKFIGLGKDMHVFVANMSYIMDFTILENIETNIDPSLSNVVFG